MNVALFISKFDIDNSERAVFVKNAALALTELGDEVVVVTMMDPPSIPLEYSFKLVYLLKYIPGMLRKFPLFGKIYLNSCLSDIQKEHSVDCWCVEADTLPGERVIEYVEKMDNIIFKLSFNASVEELLKSIKD